MKNLFATTAIATLFAASASATVIGDNEFNLSFGLDEMPSVCGVVSNATVDTGEIRIDGMANDDVDVAKLRVMSTKGVEVSVVTKDMSGKAEPWYDIEGSKVTAHGDDTASVDRGVTDVTIVPVINYEHAVANPDGLKISAIATISCD